MTRQSIGRIAVLLMILLAVPLVVNAQSLGWKLDADGFFDNSEGDDTYRATTTYAGLNLAPQVSLSSKNEHHKIVAGWNAFLELGDKTGFTKGWPIAYYQYQSSKLRFLFGSMPRTLLYEQMPDYLVCDSIRYYRPLIMGFDFLFTTKTGHLEFFLDWTQRRTMQDREQFMAALMTRYHFGMLQIGLDGYYYHYALEKNGLELGHHIHDNLVAHPYLGLDLSDKCFMDSLCLRTGVLFQADRDRADDVWHAPVGFLGELFASWHRIFLRQTVYCGGRQQYFGNSGFGEYYWGDTYVQSPWYSGTRLGYDIFRSSIATVSAQLAFHVTSAGLNWHQLITLSFALGGKIKEW